jgi:hypothetical protein
MHKFMLCKFFPLYLCINVSYVTFIIYIYAQVYVVYIFSSMFMHKCKLCNVYYYICA